MRLLILLVCAVVRCSAAPAVPPLLAEAARQWEQERHRWAFTQRVREWDGRKLVTERVERYDPTRGNARRWQLLEVRGRPPTAAEARALERKKNRPPRHAPKPITSWVDLANARPVEETAERIDYQLPVRSGADWLFPDGRVEVIVTLNKRTRAIERARVGIDGPFKVALGLARVIDLDLDLTLPPEDGDDPNDQPAGTAQAVVNRLGRRLEYSWSDFTRAPADPAAPPPSAGQ